MGGLAPLITMAPAPWFLMPFPPVAYDALGKTATGLIAVSSTSDGTLAAVGEAAVPDSADGASCPTASLGASTVITSRPARQSTTQIATRLPWSVVFSSLMIPPLSLV